MGRFSIHPSVPTGRAQEPARQALDPVSHALEPLRPGWLALRPAWLGLRLAWLALGPSRGGNGQTDGRMDGWMDGRKISPFYRTLSPIGAAALPPPMKTKEEVEQGKGTADHLMPLGDWFLFVGHKSC